MKFAQALSSILSLRKDCIQKIISYSNQVFHPEIPTIQKVQLLFQLSLWLRFWGSGIDHGILLYSDDKGKQLVLVKGFR